MTWRIKSPLCTLTIVVVVLVADLLSKLMTHLYLPVMHVGDVYPYGGVPVFQNFFGIELSFSHAINHGAAWGIFAEFPQELLILRLLLITGLTLYFLFFNKHPRWEFPLAMVIAGAVGNVIDVFLYGHVVDMIHVILWGYDYPVFNVADSAISIGLVWLIISCLLGRHSCKLQSG